MWKSDLHPFSFETTFCQGGAVVSRALLYFLEQHHEEWLESVSCTAYLQTGNPSIFNLPHTLIQAWVKEKVNIAQCLFLFIGQIQRGGWCRLWWCVNGVFHPPRQRTSQLRAKDTISQWGWTGLVHPRCMCCVFWATLFSNIVVSPFT